MTSPDSFFGRDGAHRPVKHLDVKFSGKGRPRSGSRQPSPEDLLSAQAFWDHVQARLSQEEAPCPDPETPPAAVSPAQPDLQGVGATEATEPIDLDDSVVVEVIHFDPERVQAVLESSPDEYFDSLLDQLAVSAEK